MSIDSEIEKKVKDAVAQEFARRDRLEAIELPNRHGQSWSRDEKAKLLMEMKNFLATLAPKFGRTYASLCAKIQELSKDDSWY